MGWRVRVDPGVYVLGAVLLLLLPLKWLLAALAAALIHELFHGLAIHLVGGRLLEVRIGVGGAVMEADLPGSGAECLCALAGPAGSLLLLSLFRVCPEIAVCAGVQGLFNLMPVYPLDGGRALRCGFNTLSPGLGERIGNAVQAVTLAALVVAAVAGCLRLSLGILPFGAVFFWLIRALSRKRPCKQRRIRVQ